MSTSLMPYHVPNYNRANGNIEVQLLGIFVCTPTIIIIAVQRRSVHPPISILFAKKLCQRHFYNGWLLGGRYLRKP